MDPKRIRTLHDANRVAAWLFGISSSVCGCYAWYSGYGLFSYSYFQGTAALWSSGNSVFLCKAGAVFLAMFEGLWGMCIEPAVVVHHWVRLTPLLSDIVVAMPIAIWVIIAQIDDATAPGAPQQPLLLNLEALGLRPIFGKRKFNLKRDYCFYLGPITPEMSEVYLEYVAEPLRKLGFNIRRADEIFGASPVMEDIWDRINESFIIVADVSGRNPNVMYEIGMAHTVGKKVIIVTQTMDDVPFDLRHIRCIVYCTTPSGLASLREHLLLTVQNETGLLNASALASREVDSAR